MSEVKIIGGPSKFDVMTSLFVWKPQRHQVTFVTEEGIEITATISRCEAEDGSGESWNISGYILSAIGHTKPRVGKIDWEDRKFNGSFRTDNRKGLLIIVDKT